MGKTIVSIVCIALAGGAFFFYTKPAYDQMQVTQAQIDQYNQALDKATQLQTLKQSLLSKYNAFNQGDVDRLAKLLPDQVDNIGLILDLNNLASKYGLPLENVDVSTPASVGKAGTPISAIGGGNQKYDSLTLKFSTSGTYANFIQFMTDLESSLRIVDLVSLSIERGASPVQTQAGNASDPLYTYNITLRTYWLK